jgi:acyl carrier protein
MDIDTMNEKLMEIVCHVLEVEPQDLDGKLDLNFFEDLNVDSLLALEIVADVEKIFDIKIEDEEVVDLVTYNSLLKYTTQKIKEQAQLA